MRQVGVVINLGHGLDPCPVGGAHAPQYDQDNDTEDLDDPWEDKPLKAGRTDENGNVMFVIVDKSGIHHIPVRWCQCPGCPEKDIQLLSMDLFPASYDRIQTAFTFHVLDDFLLDNLECKTSAYHYCSKLARVTSPVFPHTVPVSLMKPFSNHVIDRKDRIGIRN
jgi:CxC2 like cysteine cluster associated with KDZ transposases